MNKKIKYILILLLLVTIAVSGCQTTSGNEAKPNSESSSEIKEKDKTSFEKSEVVPTSTLKPGPWELKRVSRDITTSERKPLKKK